MRGRHVLLVDDILDTGRTLSRVTAILRALKPRSLKICVLLDKPSRRIEKVKADYTGFTIPDQFVIGYGLDYAEKYRNLPFVGVLKPEMYAEKKTKSPPGALRPQSGINLCVRRVFGVVKLPMQITVHFYSYFKELTGCAEAKETLPDRTTLGRYMTSSWCVSRNWSR